MTIFQPINFQDLIVNSPISLLDISLLISAENLVLDQDNNFDYSHYLFAPWSMNITGSSYILITSRS